MTDLLLYGDTDGTPALHHELGIAVLDPFLYAEVDGKAWVMASIIELERLTAAVPDAEIVSAGHRASPEVRQRRRADH